MSGEGWGSDGVREAYKVVTLRVMEYTRKLSETWVVTERGN